MAHLLDGDYKIAIHSVALEEKIPPGDPRWSTFNDQFENQTINPSTFANKIYAGHAYTTWHSGRRSLENFTLAQHIALDFDTGDERSSFDGLKQNELIASYAGLFHTTPSHTPELPRARVIFFLDSPIQNAKAYADAARFLIAHAPGADSACKDASRFFYGAKGADILFLDNIMPMAHLRHMYHRWRQAQATDSESGQPQPAQATKTTSFVPPPGWKPSDEVGRLRDALTKIDPWRIEYDEWIAVLAAIHDVIGDEALHVAQSWAQGKPGEVERKWNTFGKYAGDPATLGTVYYLAEQFGGGRIMQ